MKIVTNPSVSEVKKLFSVNDDSNNFRYFVNRDFSCIQNHLVTILFYEDEEPVSYGHLDLENNDTWLGIYVSPKYRKRGYGKMMMGVLMSHVNKKVKLSVDKTNTNAMKLYEYFLFKIIGENEKSLYMEYNNV